MRQHDLTTIPTQQPDQILQNFLRLARHLGQKKYPDDITQVLCAPPEIGIEKVHKSRAEAELLIGEILAGADVTGGPKTVD